MLKSRRPVSQKNAGLIILGPHEKALFQKSEGYRRDNFKEVFSASLLYNTKRCPTRLFLHTSSIHRASWQSPVPSAETPPGSTGPRQTYKSSR